jgi:hypothetical protein
VAAIAARGAAVVVAAILCGAWTTSHGGWNGGVADIWLTGKTNKVT